MNTQELIDAVKQWGIDKGITGPRGRGTLLRQLEKTQEELNETKYAAISNNMEELVDGIGDCAVTLILAAEMACLSFEDCLQAAYDEIKARTGKMIDGQFVKDCQ